MNDCDPEDLWSFHREMSEVDLEFWFSKDPLYYIIGNDEGIYSLYWGTASKDNIVRPDMKKILKDCPLSIDEDDTSESINKKIQEFFIEQYEKKKGKLDLAQKADPPEQESKAQIIFRVDKIPSNVKARIESLNDPGVQKRKKAWMDETDPELKAQKEQEMWNYLYRLGEELEAQDEAYRTMGPPSGNRQLFRDMAQEVTSFMVEYKVIKEPELTYLYDDQGILDEFFQIYVTDPDILALKEKPKDLYLRIVGMHALGAGMYVTLMQNEFGHTVDEFTPDEIEKIFSDFQNEDAYVLGLRQCGIPVDSNNKRVLDHIILTGMDAAKASVGSAIFEPKNIKTYMQVLYNAGNTIIMRRQ